jgi:acetolactate synthase-1/2/3 large subunit
MRSMTGGQLLVDALRSHHVDTIYCIPGESYLPVLDALHDAHSIRTVVARHEGAACYMAEAYGKLTGQPGICFVTRGPGASHASVGLHAASEDSTPLILFIGQVETQFLGRGAFQEIDYSKMFGGIAKAVHQVRAIADLPKIINDAFELAVNGRPGPVVVELPEDILFSSIEQSDLGSFSAELTKREELDMSELEHLLVSAERPIVVIGGSCWSEEGLSAFRQFIHRYQLPVVAGFRRQDLFDNEDTHYIGMLGLGVNPALIQRVRDADVVLVVGSRLSEVTSNGYSLFRQEDSDQKLIHLYTEPNVLADIYKPSLAIHAPLRDLALALAALPAPAIVQGASWLQAARQEYELFIQVPVVHPRHTGVDMGKVVQYLNDHLTDDAIICNGAGNFTVWVHRFYKYRSYVTELAPTNGSMGYGLPAAIAAKIRHPEKTVVCFSGDGCFMMYPQELATAVQEHAAVIVLIVNNGMYGTIRMHQEREYPGRVFASDLVNPDFVALANSFGAYAERVTTFDEFPTALARALASKRPSVIELTTDPVQLSPTKRLQ